MRRFVGLMSGTSVDAVDAALVEIDEFDFGIRTGGFASLALDDALRDEFHALQASGPDELERAMRAGVALADRYADAVEALLAQSGLRPEQINAIGAHGQTVRHRPEQGYSIQLLNAARLAERCGIAVVHDLRAADIAAGGQGAPLVPAFHAQVFRSPLERRAIVNLGGIANVTLLPADCGSEEPVRGFDTGPANTLLDAWCRRHTGRAFDADGAWARSAAVHEALLARMLSDPYFSRPAPKSTGRDLFDSNWLQRAIDAACDRGDLGRRGDSAGAGSDVRVGSGGSDEPAAADVQATLVELTAVTVARACADYGAQAVYACGGGTRNAFLMERLAHRLAPTPLETTAVLRIDPQAVEAAAFAWLAAQRIDAKAANLTSVTGACGPRVLGAISDPRVSRS
ncbi:MAG: anhydro-N-acetylmuramic acid kinase [Burkholderiaceae bacterium]|nr:anhydro-N-acetylmuramic acid kinase [Burkholderiaceae bacterium]